MSTICVRLSVLKFFVSVLKFFVSVLKFFVIFDTHNAFLVYEKIVIVATVVFVFVFID